MIFSQEQDIYIFTRFYTLAGITSSLIVSTYKVVEYYRLVGHTHLHTHTYMYTHTYVRMYIYIYHHPTFKTSYITSYKTSIQYNYIVKGVVDLCLNFDPSHFMYAHTYVPLYVYTPIPTLYTIIPSQRTQKNVQLSFG